MTFDEIQSIWNSQQPMDETIDKDELQKWMRAKNQSFARWVGISELAMIAVVYSTGSPCMPARLIFW